MKAGGVEFLPQLINNSGENVYYKSEGWNSDRTVNFNPYTNHSLAYPVESGKALYSPVDAVASKKYNDMVGNKDSRWGRYYYYV